MIRILVGLLLALVGPLLAMAQPADHYPPADYLSGTLPVLHVDVEGGDYITVKQPYRQATCWMVDTDGAVDIADVNAVINTMLGKSKNNNILTINDL